jgi:hypothetical protein
VEKFIPGALLATYLVLRKTAYIIRNTSLPTPLTRSVSFHLPGKPPWIRSEIISAEQGTYQDGVWKPLRLWNGDETDRGLCFYQ